MYGLQIIHTYIHNIHTYISTYIHIRYTYIYCIYNKECNDNTLS